MPHWGYYVVGGIIAYAVLIWLIVQFFRTASACERSSRPWAGDAG